MPKISSTEARVGVVLIIDGKLAEVTEYQHIKPGKGPAKVKIKVNAHPRFLVRLRLDLLLSGGVADRPAGGRGRRDGPLPAVPAGSDLQGAGVGLIAVQRLRDQGPPHVARP